MDETRPDAGATKPADRPARQRPLGRFGPLVLVAAASFVALVAGYMTGVFSYLKLENVVAIRDGVQGYLASHRTLSVLAYIAIYAIVVSLSLPGAAVLTLTGGLMFGTLLGGGAAVIGATIGAVVIFLVARTAFGSVLAERAGPAVQKLRAGFQENALSYLLFLRLVPAFPFFLVNLVPGLFGVPLRTYVIGTFFGVIPASLAFASVGAGFDSIVAEAQRSYDVCVAAKGAAGCTLNISAGSLVTTEIKTAFVLLGLLALLPVGLKKWRARRAA